VGVEHSGGGGHGDGEEGLEWRPHFSVAIAVGKCCGTPSPELSARLARFVAILDTRHLRAQAQQWQHEKQQAFVASVHGFHKHSRDFSLAFAGLGLRISGKENTTALQFNMTDVLLRANTTASPLSEKEDHKARPGLAVSAAELEARYQRYHFACTMGVDCVLELPQTRQRTRRALLSPAPLTMHLYMLKSSGKAGKPPLTLPSLYVDLALPTVGLRVSPSLLDAVGLLYTRFVSRWQQTTATKTPAKPLAKQKLAAGPRAALTASLSASTPGLPPKTSVAASSSWQCSLCSHENGQGATVCAQCTVERPSAVIVLNPHLGSTVHLDPSEAAFVEACDDDEGEGEEEFEDFSDTDDENSGAGGGGGGEMWETCASMPSAVLASQSTLLRPPHKSYLHRSVTIPEQPSLAASVFLTPVAASTASAASAFAVPLSPVAAAAFLTPAKPFTGAGPGGGDMHELLGDGNRPWVGGVLKLESLALTLEDEDGSRTAADCVLQLSVLRVECDLTLSASAFVSHTRVGSLLATHGLGKVHEQVLLSHAIPAAVKEGLKVCGWRQERRKEDGEKGEGEMITITLEYAFDSFPVATSSLRECYLAWDPNSIIPIKVPSISLRTCLCGANS
jgi:hypothetical protein